MAELKTLSQFKPLDADVKTQDFLRKSSPAPTRGNAALQRRNGADPDSRFRKLMAWGGSGEGKTLFIEGLLRAGLGVFEISTDVGGDGLVTVENHLKSIGRPDLLANMWSIELPDYESIELFMKEPEKIAGNADFYDLPIDFLVWDGFSGFQVGGLDEYVMGTQASGKEVPELREAGLFANQQDWGAIKRGTIKQLQRFLTMHNKRTGKLWHKYVTCLQADKKEQYGSDGKAEKGPFLQGAAKKLIEPAFDLIWWARSSVDTKGKREYWYDFGTESDMVAKSRGFAINAKEEADGAKLWAKIAPAV
jgi:hypothetical protein